MYKIVIALSLVFVLFACSSQDETPSVIQNELKNQNVADEATTQKSTQIQADFQKDLDGLYESLSGSID